MIEEGNVDMTDTSQPERTKLFHLLKAAWPLPVDEFFPLTYPFSPTDHVFTDARVVVREDEPSSIIAFTLDSQNYREQLAEAGLLFSGTSPDGTLVEFVEYPKDVHPYFVATQAHPEYKSRPTRSHPLFQGLVDAALNHQAERS